LIVLVDVGLANLFKNFQIVFYDCPTNPTYFDINNVTPTKTAPKSNVESSSSNDDVGEKTSFAAK
jgi:hypothetical protein